MKKYYYSDGKQQIGPLSKEELQSKGISKETLIWCEGLTEWTKAGDVEELVDLFPNIPTPPPLHEQKTATPPPMPENKTVTPPLPQNAKKNNKKKRTILLSIAAIIIIVIAVFVMTMNEADEKNNYQPTEEMLRVELEMKERADPLKYLSTEEVYLTKDDGLFIKSNKGVISGYIVNKATMAKYKDVKVAVTYYSKTKSKIATDNYVLYEYYDPGWKKPFSINVTYPKAYDSFSLKIIDAKAAY